MNNTNKLSIIVLESTLEKFKVFRGENPLYFKVYLHNGKAKVSDVTTDRERLERIMTDLKVSRHVTLKMDEHNMVDIIGIGGLNRKDGRYWIESFMLWLLVQDLITQNTYLHFVKSEWERFSIR